MTPGEPSVCPGVVWHRRIAPRAHEFERSVSYAWLDPDRPEQITDRHPLWSHRRPAPARFRRADYGIPGSDRPLGDQVRDELAGVLGARPDGPLRMLTQFRRWGWLFNPLSLYLAWDGDVDAPIGAVLEVTNTPWKERTRYATALGFDGASRRSTASFPKSMHVSPFLDEGYDYELRLGGGATAADPITVALDVVERTAAREPVVRTALTVERVRATRSSLSRTLMHVAPTHRVSAGIHVEAARLWAKGVPVVPHPNRRSPA